MKKLYYIYLIPFKNKVGCCDNIKRRMQRQGVKEGEFILLEAHYDINIASDRERELQKRYGYRIDRASYSQMSEMGKKGGIITSSIPGHMSRAGKKGGKIIGMKMRKLTLQDAEEIRRIYICGDNQFGQKPLARRYGVTQPVIHRIVNGKAYTA